MKKRMWKKPALVIILLALLLLMLSAGNTRIVAVGALFSIQFDSNAWVILSIDKEFLGLVAKDITADTVSFNFKPKKEGVTPIVFFNSLLASKVEYTISITSSIAAGMQQSGQNTQVVQNQTDSGQNYFDIAMFLFENGIYQAAKDYFLKGKEFNPEIFQQMGLAKYSYYLGICSYHLGNYETASSYLSAAKTASDEETRNYAYYYMAKVQFQLKNIDIGLENLYYLLYHITKASPIYDNCFFLVASTYYGLKKWDDLISLLYPKIESFSDSVYVLYFYFYLGMAFYEGKKDYQNAYIFLTKITNENFEFYSTVVSVRDRIQNNFVDFH